MTKRTEYFRQWRAKNRDKYNRYIRAWRKKNPLATRAHSANYLANKSGVTGEKITLNQLIELLKNQDHRCCFCGRDLKPGNMVLARKTPPSVGGKHTIDNMVFCCSTCRALRHNLDFEQFKAKLARLS